MGSRRRDLVNFVRATGKETLTWQDSYDEQRLERLGREEEEVAKGNKIKDFYENLVKASDSSTLDVPNYQYVDQRYSGTKRNCTETGDENNQDTKMTICRGGAGTSTNRNERPSSDSRLGQRLLKYAQNGDLRSTQCLLKEGVDINYQDSYGWTALMSAAFAGKYRVVEHLLNCGADKTISDKMGRDAKALASQQRHVDIVDLLDSSISWAQGIKPSVSQKFGEEGIFYCSVCKENFSHVSEKKHSTSTLHLFNLKLKTKGSSYFIPESNRGFQMMVKSGWDVEKGLGSEGKGRKFPVQTVLKRDRHGLGTKEVDKKPRVTHFGAKDTAAVNRPNTERKMRSATLSKRARQRKESKEKQWERKFRLYMNSE